MERCRDPRKQIPSFLDVYRGSSSLVSEVPRSFRLVRLHSPLRTLNTKKRVFKACRRGKRKEERGLVLSPHCGTSTKACGVHRSTTEVKGSQ